MVQAVYAATFATGIFTAGTSLVIAKTFALVLINVGLGALEFEDEHRVTWVAFDE